MEIGHIIKGHVNELLDKNKDISEVRMEICRKCPLYRDILGGQCNPNLWLNPETNEISNRRTVNYIKGCGCRLRAKTRLENESCPAKKW